MSEFLTHVKALSDMGLLKCHDELAKQRLMTFIGRSYAAEKEVEDRLYEAYKEIQNRIEAGKWIPHKPRRKRLW